MAGSDPRPTCQDTTPQNVKDGTTCVAVTSPPQPLGLCKASGIEETWNWGYMDVLRWKVLPKSLGGDPAILRRYKDGWVRAHRKVIKEQAALYGLPPLLLGGVAWIEAGGKPYASKVLVYDFRKFDHSADPLLEPLTISKGPGMTSMGPVAIQLRRAAETMGADYDKLSDNDKSRLVDCVQNADNELAIVAKHLWNLKQIDFPDKSVISEAEIRIIGARYNRGPQLRIEEIRRNTSYGDAILRFKGIIEPLLAD